jgi:hypothetical protein
MTIHSDDLRGTTCAVIDCIEAGEVRAGVTVEPLPEVGAVEDELEFDVWLCGQHGHLVRSGATRVMFTPPVEA